MILRRLAFAAFRTVYKLLYGTGISRLRPVLKVGHLLLSIFGSDCLVVEGRRLYFDHWSTSLLREQLSIFGEYEPGTTALFKRLVKRGMVVVDIGAHIGYYTLLAAELVGSNGKVYAFEPNPSSFALLVKNVRVNGYNNVIPIEKGIANYRGSAKLFDHSPYGEESTMYSPKATHDSRGHAIEVISLDKFFSDYEGCAVDLIKMDIEGAEMAALEGMKRTIDNNPELRLIGEFYPPHLEWAGVSPREFLNRLDEYGFKRYVIDESTGCLECMETAQLIESCRKEGRNLLFERDVTPNSRP